MSELEARVDAVAVTVPGVAATYRASRPFGGVLAFGRDEADSVVKESADGVDVTVCIGLRVEADATAVSAALASAVRAIPGLGDARVHVRVARIHFEDALLG